MNLEGFTRLSPPPSANRYWRIFRGKATRSAEANQWLRYAADLLIQDQPRIVGSTRVRMVLQEGKGVMITSDLDNFLKATMDVLQPEQIDEETGNVKRAGSGRIPNDNIQYVRSLVVDVIPEVKPSKSKRGEAAWFVKVEPMFE